MNLNIEITIGKAPHNNWAALRKDTTREPLCGGAFPSVTTVASSPLSAAPRVCGVQTVKNSLYHIPKKNPCTPPLLGALPENFGRTGTVDSLPPNHSVPPYRHHYNDTAWFKQRMQLRFPTCQRKDPPLSENSSAHWPASQCPYPKTSLKRWLKNHEHMTLAQDTYSPSLAHITREIRSNPPELGGNGGGLRRSDLDHPPGHGPPMADEGEQRRVKHLALVSLFFRGLPIP